MIFDKNVKIEKNDSLVVLINIYNGLWYRVTHEVFEALNFFVASKMTKEEFIDECVDSTDKDYFEKTIDYLCKIGIMDDHVITIYPENIGLSVTHRCNLSCRHCSYNAGSLNEKEKLCDSDIIEIMKKIIEYNPSSLSVTGGEPLVRRNIGEVMNLLIESRIQTRNLMTNGLLLNKVDIKKLLNAFNSFDISIDGIDDKTCSLIRGHGIFDQVIQNVKLLISSGVDSKCISLSMVMSSENEKVVENFYKLNDELGTTPVVRSFAYLGRGAENKDLYKIEKNKLRVVQPDLSEMTAMNCGAAKSEIYVDCDGDIYPCPMILEKEFVIGNIGQIKNLRDYFENGEHVRSSGYLNFIKKYMPENYEPCSKCKNKYFCIHCPVQHYLYLNKEFKNEYCEIKKSVCKKIWGK